MNPPDEWSRTAHRLAALGLLMIALAACAVDVPAPTASAPASNPSATAGTTAPAVNAEMAIALARPYLATGSEETLTATLNAGAGRAFFEISGTNFSAGVDATTGLVMGVLRLDLLPDTAMVSKIPVQAQEAAAAFLTEHGIPFDGMDAAVELIDHGTAKEYRVTWTRTKNGILLDDERQVSVNPRTGAVFGFTDTRPRPGAAGAVLVDRDTAIRAAVAMWGQGAGTTVDEATLIVSRDPRWPGRTVWSVQLTSGLAHALIYVDAETGVALIMGLG